MNTWLEILLKTTFGWQLHQLARSATTVSVKFLKVITNSTRIKNSQLHNSSFGFTMIELLVVVSLTVMLMLTASAVFMTFLIGNTKTSAEQSVKTEGDFTLSQIEFLQRNAIEVVANSQGVTCQPGMNELRFVSYDDGVTTLSRVVDPTDNKAKIASNTAYLTAGTLELVDPADLDNYTANPQFDCVQSDDQARTYITTSFTLRRGVPGVDQPKEIVTKTFTTGVNVRSF